jgi:hypothetical protein
MGWQKVLCEYLFKGDDKSEDMLFRMFAGESSLMARVALACVFNLHK